MEHVLLISVDGTARDGRCPLHRRAPRLDAGAARRLGARVHRRAHADAVGLLPGLLALVTGGTPEDHRRLLRRQLRPHTLPAGQQCQGSPGTECTYFEILAKDFTQLFSPIDPGNLPMRKDTHGNCTPVFPHDFIKVNTLFEVIREAGGYTAWSDKHQAYDLVNGPSGKGVNRPLRAGDQLADRQRRRRQRRRSDGQPRAL